MGRPSVFVGSSSEGLEVARAVQYQLADVADVEIWNEGVFGLSQGTLESLVQSLATFDFAVLVLTPDDMITSRDQQEKSARDNVLLELGLFIGRLGRARTFVVCRRDLRVPSDLAGVSMATFDMPDSEGKLVAKLGPACFRIRNAIRAFDRDMAVPQLQAELQQQQNRIDEQQNRLEHQQNIINKLVVYSMSFHIFTPLAEIRHRTKTGGEYLFEKSLEGPLRYLRDHGYLEWVSIAGLREKQNLVGLVKLTPVDHFYVDLREAFERGEHK